MVLRPDFTEWQQVALRPDYLEVAVMCLVKRSRGKRGLIELPNQTESRRLRQAAGPACSAAAPREAHAHLGLMVGFPTALQIREVYG